MDLKNSLEEVEELLCEGKYEKAHKQLDKLDKKQPQNSEVLWWRVLLLHEEERNQEARAIADSLVEQRRQSAEFWLVYAALRGEDLQGSLTDLDRALEILPNDFELMEAKADVLSAADRFGEVRKTYDQLIAAHPENERSWMLRGNFTQYCATKTGQSDAAAVVDERGTRYARRLLEAAVVDFAKAAALSSDWPVLVKYAKTLRILGREEQALAAFDAALALTADDPLNSATVKGFRDGRQAGEVATLDYVRQNMRGDGFKSVEDQMADSMLASVAEQMRAGRDMQTAMESVIGAGEDPLDLVAVNVARQLFNLGTAGAPEMQPVDADAYPKYMKAHCDRVQKALEAQGYRLLGDYEPLHITGQLGQRVMMRCFLSADGSVSANAYAMRPLWPGWIAFVLLFILRKWKTMRVLDCESELSDGRVFATANTGPYNFYDYGPHIVTEYLPIGASVPTVVQRHLSALEQASTGGGKPVPMKDFDEMVAMQTRMQELKNVYRKQVGFATDDELRRTLGDKYDLLAQKVRDKLALMATTVRD